MSGEFLGLRLHPEHDADIIRELAKVRNKSERVRELLKIALGKSSAIKWKPMPEPIAQTPTTSDVIANIKKGFEGG